MRYLLALLLLTGCITDATTMKARDSYPDYRTMLADELARALLRGPNKDVPWTTKQAFGECAADYVVAGLTGDELKRLDPYARQETSMTVGEIKALDAEITKRLGGPFTPETLDRLNGTCPDQVPLFKRAFQ